ncbi:MAG: glycosyl hydrolase family 28 protein [Lentisphaeria bacterium]|nr:glycosyl hydrolase family 28 protein [Lentisphaeria bacterium]
MLNVKDFGAVGDGVSKDTVAVQRALDAGGMVHVPAGVYLCGSLYLRSNGGLDLAPGAVILGSPDKEDYNAPDFCPQNRPFPPECSYGAHLLIAVEQENVVIRGRGRIDGNRQAFYELAEKREQIWSRHIAWRPSQMLYFCECRGVQICDAHLDNAPYWTCFLHGCVDVSIRGLRIDNPMHTRNGDGIDIDCCQNVTVSDCIIDSGDDCITLRGNAAPLKTPRPCENITINNCVLRTICNAFRIGVGNGLVRNCTVSNVVIHDSRMGICLCTKYSAAPRAVQIEDISFNNVFIEADRPIAIAIGAHGAADGPGIKPIQRISFNQIRGRGCVGNLIQGRALGDIRDISFRDVCFDYSGGDRVVVDPPNGYSEPCHISPPAAFHLEYAQDIAFDHVRINWLSDDPRWLHDVNAVGSQDIVFNNCAFSKGHALA